ncbi:MAG: serine hydrolase domain-containing protein [Candidatus Microthrix parvicella]
MTAPRPAPPNRSRCLKPAVAGLLTVAVACGPSGISASGAESSGRLRSADSEALFAPIGPDGPGCSAAVNVDGQIVWSAAYGRASLERDEPFTPETLVDIGSTSKQFTATALGLLIDDGTISWDDSVSDHLNKLPDWSAQVTVDDLVHHTSGLPDYIELLEDGGVELMAPSTQADAVDALRGTRPAFEPGSKFEYSNSNYVLLAEIVQAATGQDLPSYLDDQVFGPLDLDAEMSPGNSARVPSPAGTAQSYEDDAGWKPADSPWAQVGDGAVQTTPGQLALWGTQYWSSDLPPGLTDLRMDHAVDMGDGGRYGLGIMSYPEPSRGAGIEGTGSVEDSILTHSGEWSGFDTGFVVAPTGQTAVAVTCNTPDGPVTGEVADELLSIWTA